MCCGCIPADTHENFVEMMNFNLLKDPIFVLFTVSNFATSLGFYVPYFCLADQAKVLEMSKWDAGLLLSIIGIANTAGRIILGFISDMPWVNRLLVYNVCLVICGIGMIYKWNIVHRKTKLIYIHFYSNDLLRVLLGLLLACHLFGCIWLYDWRICGPNISHSRRFAWIG